MSSSSLSRRLEGKLSLGRKRRFQRRLLAWFQRQRRDLHWRKNRDPYRIWVSEVMLQQTQVATVIPYFQAFIKAFPTLTALAKAREKEVLHLWQGLGYYRRARNLHRAARLIVAQAGGRFPRHAQTLRLLPGIGRYTLGAILSLAFDQKYPIVEANSRRLLIRFFGLNGDPRLGPAERRLWKIAGTLLPDRNVGAFNQALMELGALVCTSSAPKCARCPVRKDCIARRLGLQTSLPIKKPRPEPVEENEAAVVISRGEKVLLVQRPDSGRWAGFWEFPHFPVPADSKKITRNGSHKLSLQRAMKRRTGLEVHLQQQPFLLLKHGITRFRITMTCYQAEYVGGEFQSDYYQKARWLKREQLHRYPLSSPQRRLAESLPTQRAIQTAGDMPPWLG